MNITTLTIGTFIDNRDRRVDRLIPQFAEAVESGELLAETDTGIFNGFFAGLTDEESAWESKHADGFWPAAVEHYRRVSDGAVVVLNRASQEIKVTTDADVCAEYLADLRRMMAEEKEA
jgi:hypothetical protein